MASARPPPSNQIGETWLSQVIRLALMRDPNWEGRHAEEAHGRWRRGGLLLRGARAGSDEHGPGGNPPARVTRDQIAPTPGTSSNALAVQVPSNVLRGSKLVGVKVIGADNERIGDIDEILIDGSGRIAAVVVGVGGFLGMGRSGWPCRSRRSCGTTARPHGLLLRARARRRATLPGMRRRLQPRPIECRARRSATRF